MARIDEELARAVDELDDEHRHGTQAPTTDVPAVAHPVAARSPSRRNVGLLVAVLAMAAGIVALVLTSFEDAAVYSKTVEQLLAERERLEGRNVNVTGALVPGSLRHRSQPCEYRFTMEGGDRRLDVRYAQCVVPDTFRDVPGVHVDVTVVGRLVEEGYFEAKQIMAKCPSKYEEQRKNGQVVPHASPGYGGN
jgi:cytochrome c-type biogenesis protein CcmE